jgi:uncharacterized protein YaeQ
MQRPEAERSVEAARQQTDSSLVRYSSKSQGTERLWWTQLGWLLGSFGKTVEEELGAQI